MKISAYSEEQYEAVRRVLAHCRGRENAMTIDRLVEACGLPDRRVCEEILQQRLADFPFPLVSGSPGYWIPEHAAEVNEYLKSLGSRAIALFRRRKSVIRKALVYGFRRMGKEFKDPPTEQLELWGSAK